MDTLNDMKYGLIFFGIYMTVQTSIFIYFVYSKDKSKKGKEQDSKQTIQMETPTETRIESDDSKKIEEKEIQMEDFETPIETSIEEKQSQIEELETLIETSIEEKDSKEIQIENLTESQMEPADTLTAARGQGILIAERVELSDEKKHEYINKLILRKKELLDFFEKITKIQQEISNIETKLETK